VRSFPIPLRIAFPAALAGTAVFFILGCVSTGGNDSYTETDSDYGYVGPWPYAPLEVVGYDGTRPPYEERAGDHREEPPPGGDHRESPPQGHAPAPGHNEGPPEGHAPAPVHNNPRPPPSIPNTPRPSGGGSHGGGGASHSGGGGGGSRGSGGGGKK
jgi:uncharacterized membrane protein YgcG